MRRAEGGYYLKAGQRSAERSAMAEARAHLSRGLALAAEMPEGPARQLRQAELQLALGSVQMATYGSREHGSAYAAAAELCRALPPTEPRRARFTARALYGDWSDKLHRGDLASALAVGEDLYRLGRDRHDPDLRLLAAAIYGQSCFLVGRLAEAMSVLAEALRSSGPGGGCDPSGVDFGIDPEILFLGQFSRALACMGHPDQARSQAELGLEPARRLNHLPSLAIALALRRRARPCPDAARGPGPACWGNYGREVPDFELRRAFDGSGGPQAAHSQRRRGSLELHHDKCA